MGTVQSQGDESHPTLEEALTGEHKILFSRVTEDPEWSMISKRASPEDPEGQFKYMFRGMVYQEEQNAGKIYITIPLDKEQEVQVFAFQDDLELYELPQAREDVLAEFRDQFLAGSVRNMTTVKISAQSDGFREGYQDRMVEVIEEIHKRIDPNVSSESVNYLTLLVALARNGNVPTPRHTYSTTDPIKQALYILGVKEGPYGPN